MNDAANWWNGVERRYKGCSTKGGSLLGQILKESFYSNLKESFKTSGFYLEPEAKWKINSMILSNVLEEKVTIMTLSSSY